MCIRDRGNHVRTKKEILDENGTIRKRCKVIKKGEVYERQMFTIKDARFKQDVYKRQSVPCVKLQQEFHHRLKPEHPNG